MTATDNPIQLKSSNVSSIALKYKGAISILDKYKIDYCCNGDKSFWEACETTGANPEVIFHEILECEDISTPGKELRYESWSAPLLTDFIVQNHHTYVREAIPPILELLDKVCEVHADNHPALEVIREDFKKLATDLELHMKKEELVLFPAIKRMFDNASIDASSVQNGIETPILVMEEEHKQAGDIIKSIRILTNSYTPPPDACPTLLFTFKRLEEFDQDLMHHIHLENNILFQKVFQS